MNRFCVSSCVSKLPPLMRVDLIRVNWRCAGRQTRCGLDRCGLDVGVDAGVGMYAWMWESLFNLHVPKIQTFASKNMPNVLLSSFVCVCSVDVFVLCLFVFRLFYKGRP